MRHCTGHVTHTVMDHAFFHEHGIIMGSHMGGLAAAALVDGDVHDDSALLHQLQMLSANQLGGLAAGQQHGADHQVCILQALADIGLGAVQGGNGSTEDVLQIGQPVQVHIQQGNLSINTHSSLGCEGTGNTAADDDDLTPGNAGHAAQQDTTAAEVLFQILGALLNTQSAGDLAHGTQAGQVALLVSNGLKGHGLHIPADQRFSQFRIGSQVKVSEEDLVFPQVTVLTGFRLLDLDDHVSLGKHLRGGTHDHRTGLDILLIREAGTYTCAGFHQNGVAVGYKTQHIVRGNTYPIFVVFQFFCCSDNHIGYSLIRVSALQNS